MHHNLPFSDVFEGYCYLIENLLTDFAKEVERTSPDDRDAIMHLSNLRDRLRTAVEGTLDDLDDLDDMMAPFMEPVPNIEGGDFEADVLRDLAALNDPRHRPVSIEEVRAWPREWIQQQVWS